MTAIYSAYSESKNVSDCISGQTSLQKKMDKYGQFFYPFEMEFCLAALGLLLGLAKKGIAYNQININ